jgi:hypothetical protein
VTGGPRCPKFLGAGHPHLDACEQGKRLYVAPPALQANYK